MGKLIIDPTESPIQQPFDKFLDSPMVRREALNLFRKLATNDSELTGMADTAALMLNFIFEKKLGADTPEALIVLRQEIDAYVEVKKAQLQEQRLRMKAEYEASQAVPTVNPDSQADGVKDAESNR